MTTEQRPYQQEGTAQLIRAQRCILADEPGLGKSNQLLMAAEGRTLIVAPAMATDVWMSTDTQDQGEVARWRPDLLESGQVVFVPYSGLCEKGPDSRGRLTRPLDRPREDLAGRWDTVILDESHYIKQRKTHWTQAALRLQSDRFYMATGTPLPNWGHEIYTSLCALFPDEAKPKGRLGSYWRWVGQWFQTGQNYFNARAIDIGDLLPGWDWDDFTQGNHLAGRWIRRERDEVLPDLPPLTQQSIHLDMDPAQAKIYRTLKRELYAEIEDTGHEIISWSKSGVWTKLMKLCTGIEAEDPTYPKYGNKISALRELMEGRSHQTIVFCVFRQSAEAAARALRQDGFSVGVISGAYSSTDRRATAKEFRMKRLDVLVGTLGTMSEALTFTGADTCIFLERDPRPSKNEQAMRRIHRYGQTRPCLSIDLVSKGTVDIRMLDLLASKTDQQMAAIRAFDLAQFV